MSYAFSTVQADRLAGLALSAATQIDLLIKGKESSHDSLIDFADAIVMFSGLDDEVGAGTYGLDPSSSELLSTAVTLITKKSISNIDVLNQELNEIVERFRDGSRDAFRLDKLKLFCLEIHNLILKSRSAAGLHERGVFDYEYSYTG